MWYFATRENEKGMVMDKNKMIPDLEEPCSPTEGLLKSIDEMMSLCSDGHEVSIIEAFAICFKHMGPHIKSVKFIGETVLEKDLQNG